MAKIPCEDCITRAICESNFTVIAKDPNPGQKSIALIELMNKCSLMMDYVKAVAKEQKDKENEQSNSM